MDHLASPDDLRLLRQAFSLARYAKNRGNAPYGAVLARGPNVVAEGENTEKERGCDPTCHAELNLIRSAYKELIPSTFAELTLYASGEPCTMCAGAIALAGFKRVVYGSDAPEGSLGCRAVLEASQGLSTEVVGPVLEPEALALLD